MHQHKALARPRAGGATWCRGLHAALLAGGVLLAMPAGAQSVPCETSTLFASDGKGAGKVVACSRLLREVPALADAVDRLNKAVEKNAEGQRDLDRFVRSLAATSRELPPKHLQTLAQSVADKVTRANAAGAERLAREIDRLRFDLDEWRSTLSDARARGDAAKTQAVLDGQAGAAVAALDFAQAKKILDDLQQVITQTTGPYTAAPEQLARVRSDTQLAWERLEAGRASERCPQTWGTLVAQRKSAEDAEGRKLFEAAGNLYQSLNDRAMALVTELNFTAQMSGMPQRSYEGLRPVVQRLRDSALQRAAAAGARFTPEQAAFQREGLHLLDEGDALAQRGEFVQAYGRLRDAQEALMASSSGRRIALPRNDVTPPAFPNPQCR